MTLHHTVALYLYGGSYMFNVWETGAVIAYIHDFSDITVSMVKILAETKYSIALGFVFVSHMALWAYLRLWVYPYLIWTCWVTPVDFEHWIILPIYVYFLTCLLILHSYWFYMFCCIFGHYIKKGHNAKGVSDDPLSKSKLTTKKTN